MGEEKKDRLEEALLSFIERATKEPLTEAETSAVPAAAQALIALWRI